MSQHTHQPGFRNEDASPTTSHDRESHTSAIAHTGNRASDQPRRPTLFPVSENAVPQADGEA